MPNDDGLEELLGALDLKAKPTAKGSAKIALPPPNRRFTQALESSKFTIFDSVSDLGYFSWTPKGPYKSLSQIRSASEMIDMIDTDEKPNRIADIARINRSLPRDFESLPPQKHKNKYPFSHPYVVQLHVAVNHRGLNLEDVDFVFGGSTLGVLATSINDKEDVEYFSALIPGTEIVMVTKASEYEQDYSAFGFQFERLVTGEKFSDLHSTECIEHVHYMKIGKYRVLLTGQTDAVDSSNNPVEISTSNPRWWGISKMFQMISSGSIKFCAGNRRKKSLMNIKMMSLSEMISQALVRKDVRQLEKNILQNMDKLAKLLKYASSGGLENRYAPRRISFDGPGNKLELTLREDKGLLPPDEVVKDLLNI